MAYLPIEDYGIVGDMHTVALIGINVSVDWFCFPRFDSPSVFCAILDDEKGGRYQIAPVQLNHYSTKQFYYPDTNVLVTRFLAPEGIAEVVDFMPITENVQGKVDANVPDGESQLIRRVTVEEGKMTFRLVCRPAFNYARDDHEVALSENGVAFHATLSLELSADMPMQADDRGGVYAEFTLSEGESTTFVLQRCEPGEGCRLNLNEEESQEAFDRTVAYWRRWLAQCTYHGRWQEVVYRSALVLKLLTYAPTGAIVAAPTTSLPEGIGGERNWDYRYTWIRDAAFTLYALLRIGFKDEAAAFMESVLRKVDSDASNGPLQPLYGIDGSRIITEETLDHLEGYKHSQPVRIGNAAYAQFQLDIYGALMDAAYLYNKYGEFISYDLWKQLRALVNWVCDNWQQKDDGIWEVRGGKQDFVYSRVMCWLAIDRALRIADKRSFPLDRVRWETVRNEIFAEVMAKGWNAEINAFVQHYDTDTLDAANILLPLTFFVAPNDPRALGTLEATLKSVDKGGLLHGGMVYRYNVEHTDDGLEGEEGTFNICTFWLIEALTRSGQTDRARLLFERMLTNANHIGLYAEETGASGEALGNFPQAFTHLALISAIFNLDRALG